MNKNCLKCIHLTKCIKIKNNPICKSYKENKKPKCSRCIPKNQKDDEIIPIMEGTTLICKEKIIDEYEELLYSIFYHKSTLEIKADACGDLLIYLWKLEPQMHKYISEIIKYIIENTIKEK